MAAANGNVHEKAWKKAVSYLELAIPGVRWSHFPFNKMRALLPRKYYSPLSGYLPPLLLQYAETLSHLGRTEEAQKAAEVTFLNVSQTNELFIGGTRLHENHSWDKKSHVFQTLWTENQRCIENITDSESLINKNVAMIRHNHRYLFSSTRILQQSRLATRL